MEYKINDKLKALDALAKNLGLFKEQMDLNVSGDLRIQNMSKTEKARRLAFMLQEGIMGKKNSKESK